MTKLYNPQYDDRYWYGFFTVASTLVIFGIAYIIGLVCGIVYIFNRKQKVFRRAYVVSLVSIAVAFSFSAFMYARDAYDGVGHYCYDGLVVTGDKIHLHGASYEAEESYRMISDVGCDYPSYYIYYKSHVNPNYESYDDYYYLNHYNRSL